MDLIISTDKKLSTWKMVQASNAIIKKNNEFEDLQQQLNSMDMIIVQGTYNTIKADPCLETMSQRLFTFFEDRSSKFKSLLTNLFTLETDLKSKTQKFIMELIET